MMHGQKNIKICTYKVQVNPGISCCVRGNKGLVSVNADFFDQLNNAVFKYKRFRRFNHYNEMFFLNNKNIPEAVILDTS
jgi:hypothetical protein